MVKIIQLLQIPLNTLSKRDPVLELMRETETEPGETEGNRDTDRDAQREANFVMGPHVRN